MNTKIADNITMTDIVLFAVSAFCGVSLLSFTGGFVYGDEEEINCYLTAY